MSNFQGRPCWLVDDWVEESILAGITHLSILSCKQFVEDHGEEVSEQDIFDRLRYQVRDGRLVAKTAIMCNKHDVLVTVKEYIGELVNGEIHIRMEDSYDQHVTCPTCGESIFVTLDNIYFFFSPTEKYSDWLQKFHNEPRRGLSLRKRREERTFDAPNE